MTTEPRLPVAEIEPKLVAHRQVRKLEIACWTVLITLAVVRAWFTRYEFNPDSMSYLDIARAIVTGHPHAIVSAIWSPGYPVLVSFFLWIFRPGISSEFALMHLLNVLVLIGAMFCFRLFWAEISRLHQNLTRIDNSAIPDVAFWALGYTAAAIAMLNMIRVGLVAPDLLVSVFCFLASWNLLVLRRTPSYGWAVLLGLVLAVGYYVKAPFFPMGLVFIVCAFTGKPASRRTIVLGGTALATYLLLCAPYIAALSSLNSRLTFGDSARLNEAFYIDGVRYFVHWQGGPPGSGTPLHPTRKLNDFPEIYEYAADNMGTFPPWFDPTYWYAGITPHPVLTRQAVVLIRDLAVEYETSLGFAAEVVCALVIFILLGGSIRRWIRRLGGVWFIWTPGAVALLMFALIHVEPRYLGGWLVLLFAGGICAASLPRDRATLRAAWCVGIGVLVTAAASVVLEAGREAFGADNALGRSSHDVSIASALLNRGLHPGDRVALIGDGYFAFWAHLAQLRLVAEIPSRNVSGSGYSAFDFWESGPDVQQKALGILERTGAKAVIAGWQNSLADAVPSVVPAPWKRIDGTDAYIYFFPANQ
jgi:hypothetical protein